MTLRTPPKLLTARAIALTVTVPVCTASIPAQRQAARVEVTAQ